MPDRGWDEVYRALTAAPADDLSADELEVLADACFWLGKPREAISATQRAYAAHRDAGDAAKATRSARQLFHRYFSLDETAAASGWLNRAHRHIEGITGGVEAGYVALADANWAIYNDALGDAIQHVKRATEIGRRFAERDLEGIAVATHGRVLILRGATSAGLDRLDEAMVAVLSDELSPFATGWVYCLLLYTCQELGDVRRAAQWTDLAVQWCQERGQDSWYPGLCRLHQCEVRSLRGEWSVAEAEALRAATELAPFGDYLIAEGHYLAGEIRRRKGDYAGAEEAFRRAHEHGRDPQPGLALLQLAHGNAAAAANALRVAVSGNAGPPLRRGRLLAAQVQAELRLDRIDQAAMSAGELADIASQSRSPLLRAMAGAARGAVLLARGDAAAAVGPLREACDICRELSCPYEGAEVRVLLALAGRQLGDEAMATLELTAAKTTFTRLGAVPDINRVATLLSPEPSLPAGMTRREAEVLRLVAQGRSNREIAAELFISEHTVARHLSNIFRKLDVTSRSAATSFAYEHDLA